MSDAKSIFRSLTAGISFDKKRFRSDAVKFGLTSKKSDSQRKFKEFVSLPELPQDLSEESNESVAGVEMDSDSSEDEELQLLGIIMRAFELFLTLLSRHLKSNPWSNIRKASVRTTTWTLLTQILGYMQCD